MTRPQKFNIHSHSMFAKIFFEANADLVNIFPTKNFHYLYDFHRLR